MKITGSWRTSLFGFGGLLTIAANVVSMLMDGNPETNPDWSVVIYAAITAAGLLFSKDSAVSNSPKPLEEARVVQQHESK